MWNAKTFHWDFQLFRSKYIVIQIRFVKICHNKLQSKMQYPFCLSVQLHLFSSTKSVRRKILTYGGRLSKEFNYCVVIFSCAVNFFNNELNTAVKNSFLSYADHFKFFRCIRSVAESFFPTNLFFFILFSHFLDSDCHHIISY